MVSFDPVRGSEQGGTRPAAVVSSNWPNERGSTLTVVPITHTKPRKKYPQNVDLPAGVLDDLGGTIYCGQILTVSRLRLGNYVARLPDHIMLDVDDALARYLAL